MAHRAIPYMNNASRGLYFLLRNTNAPSLKGSRLEHKIPQSTYVFRYIYTSTQAQRVYTDRQQHQQMPELSRKIGEQEFIEEPTVDFAPTRPQRDFCELNFNRAHAAFEQKTTKELLRAFVVLQLSSYRLIVDNSLQVGIIMHL